MVWKCSKINAEKSHGAHFLDAPIIKQSINNTSYWIYALTENQPKLGFIRKFNIVNSNVLALHCTFTAFHDTACKSFDTIGCDHIEHQACKSDDGIVICLDQTKNNLHMIQLLPLPHHLVLH